MRASRVRSWLLVLALWCCLLAHTDAASHKKVLLKDVSAITLSATKSTAGRRSSPVPQLSCVGGPCKWAPSTVLCTNAGFDGADVLWKCKADLEKGIKLGDISVSCEGFDYPDDPYILRDSCGLEYTLTGVAEVEKNKQYQTGHGHNGHQQQHSSHRYASEHSESSGASGGSIFMIILVAGIGYVLYKTCTSGASAAADRRGGGGGPGGPGSFPPSYPGGGLGSAPPSYSASSADCAPTQSSSSSSGPGFFTGAAGGAALGYMLGRRSGNQQSYNPGSAQPASSWGSSGGSSFFGGGGSSSGPSSMGTSSSSSFGGTRRR